MKLTPALLKKIIKEEIELNQLRVLIKEMLNEAPPGDPRVVAGEKEAEEIFKAASKKAGEQEPDEDELSTFKQQNGAMALTSPSRVEAAAQAHFKSKK
jgi:hypothetical protein